MPQQQLFHTSITGHHRGITGCRVIVFVCQQSVVFSIGTFMIQRRHPFQSFVQCGYIPCITAIGVCSGLIGRQGQSAVRHHFPLLRCPVGTRLDVVKLAGRYLVEIGHVATDMGHRGFLAEQVAATLHTMFQRNGLHRQRTVFVDDLLNGSVHLTEIHLIVKVVTEHSHLLAQDFSQLAWSIDGQSSRSSQQSEGAQHTHQSETVVAMQMRYEYRTDLRKPQSGASQLYLGALTAVHQKQLPPDLNHLCRRVVLQCRQCTATT